MFNRTTSKTFFALRNQARKEKDIATFSDLGVFCAFTRVVVYPDPPTQIQGKISNMFG